MKELAGVDPGVDRGDPKVSFNVFPAHDLGVLGVLGVSGGLTSSLSRALPLLFTLSTSLVEMSLRTFSTFVRYSSTASEMFFCGPFRGDSAASLVCK